MRAGATLVRTATTGSNRLPFTGRIGRTKLRRGGYRARFTATDAAGNQSRTQDVRFTVAPR